MGAEEPACELKMRLDPWRESVFPNLAASRYRVTSEETAGYNCIALAAGTTNAWWWPDAGGEYYWPGQVPREETLEAFVRTFALAGYEACDEMRLEAGFEKVAIYVDAAGTPTHAARQLESGEWTSKLGSWEDIEHDGLDAVGGQRSGLWEGSANSAASSETQLAWRSMSNCLDAESDRNSHFLSWCACPSLDA